MSTQRRSKKAEQRQKAVDMYIRGGGYGLGQAVEETAVLQAPGSTGAEQELFTEATAPGDDSSVSSEDRLSAVEMTPSSSGELGAEEVEAGQEIEVHQETSEEMAEAAAAPEEEKYLLDSWHAEYSDAGQRAMMLAQAEGQESVLEIVIGADDRVRVTNVTAFPWRVICSLQIRAQDGSRWIGTGWLIGRRTLITAGHCVYIHDRGGWATRIEVIPGRNAAGSAVWFMHGDQFSLGVGLDTEAVAHTRLRGDYSAGRLHVRRSTGLFWPGQPERRGPEQQDRQSLRLSGRQTTGDAVVPFTPIEFGDAQRFDL